MWEHARKEKVDPKFEKSHVLRACPNRENARKEQPLPNRTMLYTLMRSPTRMLSPIEVCPLQSMQVPPCLMWAQTLRLLPILATLRTEMELPKQPMLNTLTAEPSRAKLRKLIDEPRVR
jgi:hypothetical protein